MFIHFSFKNQMTCGFFFQIKLFSKVKNAYPGVPLNDFLSSFPLKSFPPSQTPRESVAAVGNVADCYWNWIRDQLMMVSVSLFTEPHRYSGPLSLEESGGSHHIQIGLIKADSCCPVN